MEPYPKEELEIGTNAHTLHSKEENVKD